MNPLYCFNVSVKFAENQFNVKTTLCQQDTLLKYCQNLAKNAENNSSFIISARKKEKKKTNKQQQQQQQKKTQKNKKKQKKQHQSDISFLFEPLYEKTNNLGFRPVPIRIIMYSQRSRLEA